MTIVPQLKCKATTAKNGLRFAAETLYQTLNVANILYNKIIAAQ